jgi:hypothetical protein
MGSGGLGLLGLTDATSKAGLLPVDPAGGLWPDTWVDSITPIRAPHAASIFMVWPPLHQTPRASPRFPEAPE